MNSPYMPSLDQIFGLIPLAGALILTVLCISFCWYLIEYAVTRGEDAKRAHAKDKVLEISIYLLFAMIIWWVISSL